MLEETLIRNRRGKRTPGPIIITYADNVTIILRTREEIQHVREALKLYEAACGAHQNAHKFKAMVLGTLDTALDVMGIPYATELKFLGTKMTTTISQSAQRSWNVGTGLLRKQARNTYHRALTLDQRIAYIQRCLLARVWYIARVFPHLQTI
jgi:hypothetical protein